MLGGETTDDLVHQVLLLVMDAICAQVPVADTGSLRGDIVAIMRDIAAVWKDPAHVRYLAALVAAQHDDAAFAQAYQRQLRQRRAETEVIVTRAVKRGELAPDTNRDLLLDLLDGIDPVRIPPGAAHATSEPVHMVTKPDDFATICQIGRTAAVVAVVSSRPADELLSPTKWASRTAPVPGATSGRVYLESGPMAAAAPAAFLAASPRGGFLVGTK